jgi:plastocyanin
MAETTLPRYVTSFRKLISALVALALTGAGCRDAAPDIPAPTEKASVATPVQGVHGVAPPPVGGTPSVVVLRPSAAMTETPEREAPHMDQLGLTFNPARLMVMLGEEVVFTNNEMVGHNVDLRFTDTDSTVLSADTDPAGHAEFVFEHEGGYDVLCDHHPGMRAFIYVSPSPYAVFADRLGSFQIENVPPGSYTASVWSVDPALRTERTIEVTGPSTEVSFIESPRPPESP